MSRDLRQSVVVITGASSGIGRAAARRFAAEGSRLVLAARGEPPLREIAAECERIGAAALAVPTDVRDEDAVEALARTAVERFGRLDVWVNCAGVMAYGRFQDVPSDVFRAVVETNLFGQVHGARAALVRFRAQGSGVLVNMGSVWGRVTTPDVSGYVTSKFAVRAFSECLREEVRNVDGVDVALMLPQAVDTPIFERAGNFTGRAARPIPPIYDPEEVARGILACARSPKREVTWGRAGRALETFHAFAPGLQNRVLPAAFEAGNYASRPAERSPGAVLESTPPYAIHGGWRSGRRGEMARSFLATAKGLLRGVLGR